MKANEAPKKIYIFENPISGTPDDRWLTKRSCDADIEYTRTDAFIDKACEWIIRNDSYSKPTEILVRDFRKAMEE